MRETNVNMTKETKIEEIKKKLLETADDTAIEHKYARLIGTGRKIVGPNGLIMWSDEN